MTQKNFRPFFQGFQIRVIFCWSQFPVRAIRRLWSQFSCSIWIAGNPCLTLSHLTVGAPTRQIFLAASSLLLIRLQEGQRHSLTDKSKLSHTKSDCQNKFIRIDPIYLFISNLGSKNKETMRTRFNIRYDHSVNKFY